MIQFSLPWPPNGLSPNARQHWAKHAKAKKLYRDACYLTTLSDVGDRTPVPFTGSLEIDLVFIPPDKRRYDRDNLVARMKAGLDGIAKAWGIDDSAFVRLTAEVGTPGTKQDARVEVRVTERVSCRE